MTTIEEEKKDLRKNISEMKNGSIEQMCLITMYSLGSYFKALFAFGSSSDVTRDNLNIIKEMFQILKIERTLLNYILRNIDKFDVYAAQDVIGMLDEVNDKTVIYYYDIINDIEDAAELEQEFRGRRPSKELPTLIKTGIYAGEVIALGENLESLKEFLGFEEDFWQFISDKVSIVDTSVEIMEKVAYATPVYDENGFVVSLKIMLPKVFNLESALLAIDIYKKAYEIYKMIGKKLDSEILSDSVQLQDKYRKEYLPRKANDLLFKKM